MATGKIKAGEAFVALSTKDMLTRGLANAKAKLNAFSATVGRIGQRMLTVGLGGAVGIGLAAKVFAGFNDEMLAVKAVTGATADEFARLEQQAKELGRTTSFTAKQVAGAQLSLGRAGFGTDQITQATPAVLNLARATGTELPEAAQIAADTLRAFRLEADQTNRVADVATATVNNSSQGLQDYFEAMKVIAPVAAEAGESIEDTSAAIGILANNGVKGSLAGTALRRAYLSMADPKIRDAIENLTGVSAVDAKGNLRPMADTLRDIGKATAGMPNAKRLEIFQKVFGARGLVAAANLARAGADFDTLAGELDDAAGVAEKTAKEMDSGLGGALRRLMSAAEGIALAVGDALAGPLSQVADLLSKASGAVTKFVEQNKWLISTAAAVVGGLIAGGGALIAVAAVAKLAAIAIGGLSTIVGIAGAVFGTVTAAIGAVFSPLGLLVAVVAGGAAAWFSWSASGRQAMNSIKTALAPIGAIVDDTFGGIKDALQAGDLITAGKIAMAGLKAAVATGLASLTSLFGDTFGNVAADLLNGELSSAFETIVGGMASLWEGLVGGMVDLMASAAKKVVDLWEGATGSISDLIIRIAEENPELGKVILGIDLEQIEENEKGLNKKGLELGKKRIAELDAEIAKREAAGETDTGKSEIDESKEGLDRHNLAALKKARENEVADLKKRGAKEVDIFGDAKKIARDQIGDQADAARESINLGNQAIQKTLADAREKFESRRGSGADRLTAIGQAAQDELEALKMQAKEAAAEAAADASADAEKAAGGVDAEGARKTLDNVSSVTATSAGAVGVLNQQTPTLRKSELFLERIAKSNEQILEDAQNKELAHS